MGKYLIKKKHRLLWSVCLLVTLPRTKEQRSHPLTQCSISNIPHIGVVKYTLPTMNSKGHESNDKKRVEQKSKGRSIIGAIKATFDRV